MNKHEIHCIIAIKSIIYSIEQWPEIFVVFLSVSKFHLKSHSSSFVCWKPHIRMLKCEQTDKTMARVFHYLFHINQKQKITKVWKHLQDQVQPSVWHISSSISQFPGPPVTSLLFSTHTQAIPYPPWSRRLKTYHSTQDTVSPVLKTEDQPLLLPCCSHNFWCKPGCHLSSWPSGHMASSCSAVNQHLCVSFSGRQFISHSSQGLYHFMRLWLRYRTQHLSPFSLTCLHVACQSIHLQSLPTLKHINSPA